MALAVWLQLDLRKSRRSQTNLLLGEGEKAFCNYPSITEAPTSN
jgi:hypothetical protein